jgi:hypothetical protein
VPGNDGFSPRPQPRLIATRQLPRGGHALSLARGLDRDRAVDEAGNQTSVFGRVGARPMNLKEQQKLYLKPGGHGVWQFGDDPKDAYYQERYIGPPRAGEKPAAAPPEPAAGGR